MSRKYLVPAVLAFVVSAAACSDSSVTSPTRSPTAPALAITDFGDGVWWVGKGDVQTALGLNDAGIQLLVQTNTLVFAVKRSITCYWETGNPDQPQSITPHTQSRNADFTLGSNARNNRSTNSNVFTSTGFWVTLPELDDADQEIGACHAPATAFNVQISTSGPWSLYVNDVFLIAL